MIRTRSS